MTKHVREFFQSFTENAAVTELREACIHLQAQIDAMNTPQVPDVDPEKTAPGAEHHKGKKK